MVDILTNELKAEEVNAINYLTKFRVRFGKRL